MFSSQNSQVSSAAADPYFNQITLLLHGDGTNGAQNNTFLDSSTNNFTITRNGNTTQGTFSPYGDNWSNYFDGTGDYIENTSNYLVASTTSTFTIEAWVFMTADPVDDANDIPAMISVNCGGGNNSVNYLAFGPISSRKLRIRWFDGAGKNAEGSTTLALNTWYNVACSVSSNAIKMFVNGVEETLSGTTTLTNRNGNANGFALGQTFTYANYTGYISNARVLSGTALYTTGFTPSTAPLTAITNTVLLTCQSNRFRDASSNAYAIAAAGNTSVQPFSPFAPTSAYSTAVNGGSGYFDGTGDNVSVASNAAFGFSTSDFTIEGWLYFGRHSNYQALIDFRTASNQVTPTIYSDVNGYVYYFVNGSNRITSSAVLLGAWNHIAVARSGSTTKMFINGVQAGSNYSDSNNYITSPVKVGDNFDNTTPFLGYISNLRIVKGTAVYTTTFTPPTALITAISGTSLLTNFTNAGILDNAMKNDVETIGNAQISTSVVKFGTGSMSFDGTGDYLHIRNTASSTVFGTGNWTIEGWCYPTLISSSFKVLYVNGYPVQIYQRNSTVEVYVSSSAGSGTYIVSGATGPASGITVNTWAHFAFVKNGSTYTVYINGIAGTAATSATAIPFPSAINAGIGDVGEFGAIYPFTGYIDDIRITNGVARYTAAFTPPTAAFSNQ